MGIKLRVGNVLLEWPEFAVEDPERDLEDRLVFGIGDLAGAFGDGSQFSVVSSTGGGLGLISTR